MLIALTRDLDESICRCQLTYVEREPIDVEVARAQLAGYETCLAECGCNVQRLPSAVDLADAVFIEDTCIVFPELAIITTPGSESRRAEVEAVAAAMEPYRPLYFLQEGATIDGGDVLCLGPQVFVGLSRRTNAASIEQLARLLYPHGYRVLPVSLSGCLHLKTAVTQISEDALLINRHWVDASVFGEWSLLDIDPQEPFAANSLLIGQTLVYPTAHPRTLERLSRRGVCIRLVDISELAKAEAGVTCCSLVFESGNS